MRTTHQAHQEEQQQCCCCKNNNDTMVLTTTHQAHQEQQQQHYITINKTTRTNICNAWKHGQYSWFPNEL